MTDDDLPTADDVRGILKIDIVEWLRREAELIALDRLSEAADEIERLRAAISRIDAINDNPADYNTDINAVCDTILRPHLEPEPRTLVTNPERDRKNR